MTIAGKQSLRGPALRRTGPRLKPGAFAQLARHPVQPFDMAALLRASRLFGGNERIISSPLNNLPPPSWQDGLGALRATFGLEREGHCFTTAPHDWAWFHEPQITGGFVHFLTEGPTARCTARAQAFVRAAFRCAGLATDSFEGRTVSHVVAEAELMVAARKRIDILVELTFDDGSCVGVVIEAKFGSDLSVGQLPSYRDHALAKDGWKNAQIVFLVVAPFAGQLDQKILSNNPDWSPQNWWTFLQCIEDALPPQQDCDDYRRFRRTVWDRAY